MRFEHAGALVLGSLVFFVSACAGGVALGDAPPSGESNPWTVLPAREIATEGGDVTFQGALIVDTRVALDNPLFQDYPTKYILPVTNGSTRPIWVEAEWHVPGEDPFVTEGALAPEQFGEFYRVVDEIAWDEAILVKVRIFADDSEGDPLGSGDLVLRFPEGEGKEPFLLKAEEVNRVASKMGRAHGGVAEMPLLSGFEPADSL